MFKVEFYVEDKNLHKAYYALQGIAIDAPKAYPVVNAEVKNGKIEQQTANGTAVELFHQHLLAHPDIKNVRMENLREFLRSIGHSSRSASSLIDAATDAGLIRKAKGIRQGYNVTVKA